MTERETEETPADPMPLAHSRESSSLAGILAALTGLVLVALAAFWLIGMRSASTPQSGAAAVAQEADSTSRESTARADK